MMMRYAPILVLAFAFTSPASAVTIETVTVLDPGNPGELSGQGAGGFGFDRVCGAVDYVYEIGTYEVTTSQYVAFLNAVAATDTYDLYDMAMGVPVDFMHPCHIHRAGSPGSYTYTVDEDWVDRPVNNISWGDAARFVNWLHNGQPTGPQGPGTTETGSYPLNGAESDTDLMRVSRSSHATWVIPTEDEWYKAAYYDGVAGVYYDYPTGGDTAPVDELVDPDPGNSATYCASDPCEMTDVGAHENSPSPYGTFDQGGNVFEWNEASINTDSRGRRGGGFGSDADCLAASWRLYSRPSFGSNLYGFRVAKVRDIVCGDGVFDPPAEECEDGNTTDGDGCQSDCTIPRVCGDGYMNPITEECDDGNNIDGDGCSSTCEVELGRTWHVDVVNCIEPGQGTQADPFCTIERGIDAAEDGDTVLVAAGDYSGEGNRCLSYGGKAITIRSSCGPEQCRIIPYYDAFIFSSQEGPASVLSGFTIRGVARGPAMEFWSGSSPRIENCIFAHNYGWFDWDYNSCEGGAISVVGDSNPTFKDCVFEYNTADCEWHDEFGTILVGSGGAGGIINAAPSFVNCLFSYNSAYEDGGAFYVYGGDPSFVNCVFRHNTVSASGGAFNIDSATVSLVNCTFSANSAGQSGGAVYADDAELVISSSILVGGGTILLSDSDLTAEYSCVPSTYSDGPGNISVSPSYETELRLSADSPCINAGDPTYMAGPDVVDLAGHRRVRCGRVDMGAYEFGQPGDTDCNGLVELADFATWQACVTDPISPEDPASPYEPECADLDLNGDGDVDLADFAAFQLAW